MCVCHMKLYLFYRSEREIARALTCLEKIKEKGSHDRARLFQHQLYTKVGRHAMHSASIVKDANEKWAAGQSFPC